MMKKAVKKEIAPRVRVLEVSVSPNPPEGGKKEPLRFEYDASRPVVVRQLGGKDHLYFYSTLFEGNRMVEKRPFCVGPNCECPIPVPAMSRTILTFPPPVAGSIKAVDAERTTEELRNSFDRNEL